jgi:hypothetical protein
MWSPGKDPFDSHAVNVSQPQAVAHLIEQLAMAERPNRDGGRGLEREKHQRPEILLTGEHHLNTIKRSPDAQDENRAIHRVLFQRLHQGRVGPAHCRKFAQPDPKRASLLVEPLASNLSSERSILCGT